MTPLGFAEIERTTIEEVNRLLWDSFTFEETMSVEFVSYNVI